MRSETGPEAVEVLPVLLLTADASINALAATQSNHHLSLATGGRRYRVSQHGDPLLSLAHPDSTTMSTTDYKAIFESYLCE